MNSSGWAHFPQPSVHSRAVFLLSGMPSNRKPIHALLFDLGGVLLDVSYSQAISAFAHLGMAQPEALYTQHRQSALFDALETGRISEEDFYTGLRNLTRLSVKNEQLRQAWNSMLGQMPETKVQLLSRLSQRYPLVLFSNTNAIHKQAFEAILVKQGVWDRFEACFAHKFYSHELGMRKPHPEAFLEVARRAKLAPGKTLFIDDTAGHLEGAIAAGFQVAHYLPGTPLQTCLAEHGVTIPD